MQLSHDMANMRGLFVFTALYVVWQCDGGIAPFPLDSVVNEARAAAKGKSRSPMPVTAAITFNRLLALYCTSHNSRIRTAAALFMAKSSTHTLARKCNTQLLATHLLVPTPEAQVPRAA